MNGSSQWDSVMHRYGVGLRSDMDISQGVCKIIRHLQAECPQLIVGHDLSRHFSDAPLSYLFVNSKNVRGWGNDPFLEDALTECELTFYQNDANTLRFRYFVQLTHGYLVHGISWVKSAPEVAYDSRVFNRIKAFIAKSFLKEQIASPEYYVPDFPQSFKISDSNSLRVGTMYNTVVRAPQPAVLRLDARTMKAIENLMVAAINFFEENKAKINTIINQSNKHYE